MVVKPCDQVFCNGPLYCGGPSQSQSPWNPQRGSATAVAAVTIPPRVSAAAAAASSVCFMLCPLCRWPGRYGRPPTPMVRRRPPWTHFGHELGLFEVTGLTNGDVIWQGERVSM